MKYKNSVGLSYDIAKKLEDAAKRGIPVESLFPTQPTPPSPPSQEPTSTNVESVDIKDEEDKNKRKRLFYWIGGGVLVTALVVGGVMLFRNKN